MLNFTSALYLGLYHPMHTLRPWRQFTTGTPAAITQPSIASNVAKQLAALQGLESATIGPSTFHLFWDLFGILAQKRITIHLDDGAYPIAKWGIERASAASLSVKTFKHHDADRLSRQIQRTKGKRPVIVTDGFCSLCGKTAPLADYLTIIKRFGGYLVIDDTQALGILGHYPAQYKPYGLDGGGSLRWHGIQDPHIISICSLAKGFGVPLAILSGSGRFVRKFERTSDTRLHCSPASIVDIHAAEHALNVNRLKGDLLRKKLARNVAQFQRYLRDAEIAHQGGTFPVQALPVPKQIAEQIHQRLRQHGVAAILQLSCVDRTPHVCLIITARHDSAQLDTAANVLINIFNKFSGVYQRMSV